MGFTESRKRTTAGDVPDRICEIQNFSIFAISQNTPSEM
jgi:hypothetical protein